MALDRTAFDALVDDDSSGTTGTPWNKTQIENVLLDPIDAALVPTVNTSGTPAATQLALFSDADTITGDANLTWNGQTVTAAHATTPKLHLRILGQTPQVRIFSFANALFAGANIDHNGTTFVRDDGSTTAAWVQANTGAVIVNGMLTDGTIRNVLVADIPGQLLSVSCGRVQFPATQNPSADVYTLDDYREGTWTPAIGGTGGQSGQTYSSQTGRYIKLGKFIACSMDLTLSNKGTITGSLVLLGLPFASESAAGGAPFCTQLHWIGLATNWVAVQTVLLGGATTCYIQGAQAASTQSNLGLTSADLTNGTFFRGVITYFTAN